MIFRIIARLDIKPPNLVKGIHLEGFRKIGSPAEFAERYFEDGIDEIIYQDIVASLYGRNTLTELISQTAKNIFIPLSVGGGIKNLNDAETLIRSGCDKVVLNTAAVLNPKVISEISEVLGAQAVVLGIEAIKRGSSWLVMTNSGREHTGKKVTDWIKEVDQLGIGEIMLTSIDFEGTEKGFDFNLYETARLLTSKSLIAHGGAGSVHDIVKIAKIGINGVAISSVLHKERFLVSEIKHELLKNGISIRK